MKIYNKLIVIGVALFAGVWFSCEKRHINDNIPTSVVNFSRSGFLISEFYSVEGKHIDTLYITNAGFEIADDTQVSVAVNESVLTDYNNANGTGYNLLPSEYYELEQISGKITDEQRTHPLMLIFDCNALEKLEDINNYVVPLQLSSTNENVIGELSFVIIQPNMLDARLMLDGAGITEVKFDNTSEVSEYTFTVAAEFVNQWDIQFELSEGQTVLDEYNLIHQTNFRSLPEEAYTVEYPSSLAQGVSSADIKFSLHNSAVPDGVYALAVKLISGSLEGAPIDIFEDNFAIIRIDNGKTTKRIDRSAWSIDSYDSYGASDIPEKILDGDNSTFWQPAWNASHFGKTMLPYTLVVDMGEEVILEGFELWRRIGSYASDLKAGVFDVSEDGINWTRARAFNFGDVTDKTEGPFYVYCESVNARFIRIYIAESNRNQTSNIAEFYGLEN